MIRQCCDGYNKTQNGTHCHPVCETPCVRGMCISPNVCKCEKYFGGPLCDNNLGSRYILSGNIIVQKIYFYFIRLVCPPGKFGFECTQMCQCQNNSTCNSLDGMRYKIIIIKKSINILKNVKSFILKIFIIIIVIY